MLAVSDGREGERMSSTDCRERGVPSSPFQEAPQTPYEEMVRDLYRYRFGAISFLDLLAAWEQQLGITSPPQTGQRRVPRE